MAPRAVNNCRFLGPLSLNLHEECQTTEYDDIQSSQY